MIKPRRWTQRYTLCSDPRLTLAKFPLLSKLKSIKQIFSYKYLFAWLVTADHGKNLVYTRVWRPQSWWHSSLLTWVQLSRAFRSKWGLKPLLPSLRSPIVNNYVLLHITFTSLVFSSYTSKNTLVQMTSSWQCENLSSDMIQSLYAYYFLNLYVL